MINAQRTAKLLTKHTLFLQKRTPKRVPKMSIRSQERKFEAGLRFCPCKAWSDPPLLLWSGQVHMGIGVDISAWAEGPKPQEDHLRAPVPRPDAFCGCSLWGLDWPSRRCPTPNNGFVHSCFLSIKALAQTFSWCMLSELVQEHKRPYIWLV